MQDIRFLITTDRSRRAFHKVVDTVLQNQGHINSVSMSSHDDAEYKAVMSVAVEDKDEMINSLRRLHETRALQLLGPDSISRELCLVKIETKTPKKRDELFHYANIFNATFADVSPDASTIEIIGDSHEIQRFLDLIKGIGKLEIVRTGAVALEKLR